MRGGLSNIKYVNKWYLFYNKTDAKSQQLVGQLPWGHKNARRAKKRSLLFSRFCAEERGFCSSGSGVKFFLLMYFDGLNLFVILSNLLVLTRQTQLQLQLLDGNKCFLLINIKSRYRVQ